MLGLKSIKARLIIFLSFFAVFLAVKDKDVIFLFTILIAVVCALATEAAVLYAKTKTFRLTESAVITGVITGYVLSADEVWWKVALAIPGRDSFQVFNPH